MHPKPVLVRDLANLRQGIDRAGIHRPGIGDDTERLVPRRDVGRDLSDEILEPDFEMLVDLDLADVFPADAQNGRRLGDGIMRLARGVDAQTAA